ncbi:hypothetical protein [Mesobacillus foraminis]|uniref:Uncharacterized protein n=1 Tax=Mesobacillus foraminis TaxID=279826 RepID=A0A4R2BDR1_9BACI|nr:hypothetical protein [Mesobacillus foraminis]TCN25051.1 hypothetical protein EV146_106253 [Mesobacillus foraminis]
MKKAMLILLLLANLFYIINFLFSFSSFSLINPFWLGSFVIGIVYSIIYLIMNRKQKDYHPYLSIAVLSACMGSIGLYVFYFYLSHMIA